MANDNKPKLEPIALVPVSDLPGEWVKDYLNEGTARGDGFVAELAHYAVKYTSEKSGSVIYQIVFSGADRSNVEELIGEIKLGGRILDASQLSPEDLERFAPQPVDPQSSDEEDARSGKGKQVASEEVYDTEPSALPDIDGIDLSNLETSEDTYYAKLLQLHPEHLLITLESQVPETFDSSQKEQSDESNEGVDTILIYFQIDPPISKGAVHHFKHKQQTGASAEVTATDGSVILEMWRIVQISSRRHKIPIETKTATAGQRKKKTRKIRHSSAPSIVTYDISVKGGTKGGEYTIEGSWVREN